MNAPLLAAAWAVLDRDLLRYVHASWLTPEQLAARTAFSDAAARHRANTTLALALDIPPLAARDAVAPAAAMAILAGPAFARWVQAVAEQALPVAERTQAPVPPPAARVPHLASPDAAARRSLAVRWAEEQVRQAAAAWPRALASRWLLRLPKAVPAEGRPAVEAASPQRAQSWLSRSELALQQVHGGAASWPCLSS